MREAFDISFTFASSRELPTWCFLDIEQWFWCKDASGTDTTAASSKYQPHAPSSGRPKSGGTKSEMQRQPDASRPLGGEYSESGSVQPGGLTRSSLEL